VVAPSIVSRQSLAEDHVIRAAPLWQVAAMVTYFLVPATILLVVAVLALGAPLGWEFDVTFVVGFGAFIGVVFSLIIMISINFGVILRPAGVELLRTRGDRRTLARYHFPWEGLDNVRVHGLYSEGVSFGATGLPLMVDHSTGRVILSDPRCPVHTLIPPRVAKKLRLEKPL
jgi:hypothetical protein